MSVVDVEAFGKTPVSEDPFPHLVMPAFIKARAYHELSQNFPVLTKPGSFPASELKFGQTFADFLDELQGPSITRAFSEKFDTDLTQRPTMITIRGMCRAKDGKIHTDSKTKILTVLIYMNDRWSHEGGRLRLLHSSSDLDDVITEIEPGPGTLVAFLNTENAWHGHTQFSGQRRAVQLNWVTDKWVVQREQGRHRFSAKLKKLNPFV